MRVARGGSVEVRTRLIRFARFIPMLMAAALTAVLMANNGCGRSVFPFATNSRSATATPTSSPGSGAFLYGTNFNDANIFEFKRNPTTGTLSLLGTIGAGALSGPKGIVVHPNNKFVYTVNFADGSVYVFSIASGGTLTSIGSIAAGSQPEMLTIDPSGSFLYVTNFASGAFGSISEYSIDQSTGALTAIGNVSPVGFLGPIGIVATSSFVYAADNAGGNIWTFTINSGGTLTASSAVPSLGGSTGSPVALVIDPTNSFIFTDDFSTGAVSEFTISGSTLVFGSSTSSGHTNNQPVGMAMAQPSATPTTTYLFTAITNGTVGNTNGNGVSQFTETGGVLVLQGSLSLANLVPTGIVVDSQNQFAYTGNAGDGTVSQLRISLSCGNPLCLLNSVATESPPNANAGTQFLALTH